MRDTTTLRVVHAVLIVELSFSHPGAQCFLGAAPAWPLDLIVDHYRFDGSIVGRQGRVGWRTADRRMGADLMREYSQPAGPLFKS